MHNKQLSSEIRRIARKARRFSTRNKQNTPAKFRFSTSVHPGVVLYPNLGAIS